jgi:hypothetical protein
MTTPDATPPAHQHVTTKGIEAELKRIPAWGWGVIAGVAALVGIWWFHRHEAATTDASGQPVATDTSGLVDSSLASGDVGGSAANGYTAADQAAAAFSTNGAWEAAVVAWLTSQGNSPLTVQQAVEDYLNGNPLTSAEQALVNQAIAHYGIPPEGTAPLGSNAPPVDSTPPADSTPPPDTTPPPVFNGGNPPIGGTYTPPPVDTSPPPPTSSPKPKLDTMVSVYASPMSGKVGSQVTVGATVVDAATGGGTPRGALTLKFGAQTHTVTAPEGHATFTVGKPTNGKSHNVSAHYAGNDKHNPSDSPTVIFTVKS